MKHVLLLFACCSLVVLSAVPAAAVPIPGTYASIDNDGTLLTGRSATSRACVHTCGGQGDVFNVRSWDGSALGTQWYAQCGVEPSFYTVIDSRVDGTGTVTYNSTFVGGSIWFGPGEWGSGTGTLNTTYIVSTVWFVKIGGVSTPVSSRANITSSGTFTEGNCSLDFIIANGTGVGETDAPPPANVKPATYPTFMDLSCNPTRIWGNWGDVTEILLMIHCATPARPHTWGALRRIYR
jgi:hypothetical protein